MKTTEILTSTMSLTQSELQLGRGLLPTRHCTPDYQKRLVFMLFPGKIPRGCASKAAFGMFHAKFLIKRPSWHPAKTTPHTLVHMCGIIAFPGVPD